MKSGDTAYMFWYLDGCIKVDKVTVDIFEPDLITDFETDLTTSVTFDDGSTWYKNLKVGRVIDGQCYKILILPENDIKKAASLFLVRETLNLQTAQAVVDHLKWKIDILKNTYGGDEK